MANGGSSYTDTSNSGPARAASEANLREHGVRLSKRGRRCCLRRSCEGYGKASSSNQLITPIFPSKSELPRSRDAPASGAHYGCARDADTEPSSFS